MVVDVVSVIYVICGVDDVFVTLLILIILSCVIVSLTILIVQLIILMWQ